MDIDEFLDRELSDLGLQTDKPEKIDTSEQYPGQFEPSPLVENIKANLSKGNLEQAEQAYVQLWHLLMEQKLKWNKELYDQLAALNRQFSSTLNNAYNEVKRKAQQINELISRARASLREGKKEMPFKLYSEIGEIINSIPNVFFEEKRLIQEQISGFYDELKNVTDNELIKRISALIQETNYVMNKIITSIRSNDMVNAIVNYNKCIGLYNQIPEGFLRHKNSIGVKLLEIYKSLSISTEISSLQKQLSQQTNQPLQFQQRIASPSFAQASKTNFPSKSMFASAKKERAKRNIEKGFYNEALKDVQEALQLEPNDAEARAIHAKIKTLQ
ncbi:hypothetical protein J4234_02130 [Candidatus Woesearchaeota archaeon]|nr:hypothetical protein [Candidatus Woesearchaeota archaeon]